MRRPGVGGGVSSVGSRQRLRRVDQHRQADGELAARPEPVALGLDRAAVQLDQRLRQREADAEAVARAFERSVRLREHLEQARKLIGDDPDSVVAHADHGLIAVTIDRELDVSALVGELARVVEQVAHHLSQPRRVGVEMDRLRRQRDGELVIHAAIERRGPPRPRGR